MARRREVETEESTPAERAMKILSEGEGVGVTVEECRWGVWRMLLRIAREGRRNRGGSESRLDILEVWRQGLTGEVEIVFSAAGPCTSSIGCVVIMDKWGSRVYS